MNNHSQLPFYRVLLGFICGLFALGGLLCFIGNLTSPDIVPGDWLTALLLTLLFGYWTCSCFIQKGKTTTSGFSKYNVYSILLKVLVFIVVVTLCSLISALIDMPSSFDSASRIPRQSTTGSIVSILGWILAAIMAYYSPIPKKWKERIDANKRPSCPPEPNPNPDELVKLDEDVPPQIVESDEATKQKKDVIYDREDVEL